ncbi:RecQ family ATP-dependent DNA helicase [Mangrovimonas aestuarii]|uniref:RecQ family ATP-dependent DNA helicase n=1 Tax=Mangrovimonas aestuarii TaxID=3018443 RepID=UPI002378B1CC|nr:RecQ family ATP-dependent DNA helicase [Mangrovimonas aestuarii]
MQTALNILERYWGFTSFRPSQEPIVQAVLQGKDVFGLLPTGGGKSVCFQVPALAKDGICIVVSPLIALMKDQVQNLNQKGIKALALTSGLSYQELDALLDNCIYGDYKFLYLSPERLQQELIQNRIQQMPVNLIAIDEAHCISQWGNDFRPAYKNIKILRSLHPKVNCIALTASATPKVVANIVKELELSNVEIIKQSFKRENLSYIVLDEQDKHYRLETILKKYRDSSIVYVRNRKLTLEITEQLENKGITALAFHGGLSNIDKERRLNQWLNNSKQVMIATNAFGMGIDKPDVKTVIHMNLPESMESYFQEAGRAGRDGEKSFAVIIKNQGDEELVKNQFLNVLPTVDFVKQVYKKLCNYFQIAYGEGEQSSHDFNFNHFCKTYKINSLVTYNALQHLDRTSIIGLSRQFNKKTSVQFIVSTNSLLYYLDKHSEISLAVKSILRSYGGIFDQETNINTSLLADKLFIKEERLLAILDQLERDNIIKLNQSKTDARITFIEPREDEKTINRIRDIINQQNKLKHDQVTSILDYINNDSTCKSVQLLSYFGETDATNCGRCSVCLAITKNVQQSEPKEVRKAIIHALEQGDLSSRTMVEQLGFSETDIISAIKQLLEHQIITITPTNTYKLFHI